MKTYLLNVWDTLRGSFWFVPAVLGLVALGMGIAMPLVDAWLSESDLRYLAWAHTTTAAARSTLAAVASATVAVAGTVFSITIVTLSLTSQQFGPRLLRTFMLDVPTHWTLGVFVSTSLYSLLVLRSVQDHGAHDAAPHLSVLLAVAMAVLSLAMLILFIHHVSVLVQAPHVVKSVATDLDLAIARLFPEAMGEEPDEDGAALAASVAQADRLGEADYRIHASHEGYIQAIDSPSLIALAGEHGLVIRLLVRPGDFLRRDAVLADAWCRDGLSEETISHIGTELNDAVITGMRRTPRQDVECAVDELVELAVRALSPGINDPFTAMNCIDLLSAAMARLARRRMPSAYRCDQEGHLRVIARGTTFSGVLDAAINPIRQYGRGSASVIIRLLEGLSAVAGSATLPADKNAVQRHIEMVYRGGLESLPEEAIPPHRGGLESLPEEADRAGVQERYEQATTALGG